MSKNLILIFILFSAFGSKISLYAQDSDLNRHLNLYLKCKQEDNLSEALVEITWCVDNYKKYWDEKDTTYALLLRSQAGIYFDLGEYQIASDVYKYSLSIKKGLVDRHNIDVTPELNMIARCFTKLGQYENAIKLNEEILIIKKDKFGNNHPSLAITLNNLSICLIEIGQYRKALVLNEEALRINQLVLGNESFEVAQNLNNIGLCFSGLSEFDKAIEYTNQSLNILKKYFGDMQIDIANNFNNLGSYHLELGYYKDAEEFFEKALSINQNIFGKNHPNLATILSNLAVCYSTDGQYEKAILYGEEALRIRRNSFGEEHPNVALSFNNIASDYQKIGDYKKAFNYFDKSIKINKKIYGNIHPDIALNLSNMCSNHLAQFNINKAIDMGEEAIRIYSIIYGENNLESADCLDELSKCYMNLGKYEKSIEYGEKSLKIRKSYLGEIHPKISNSLNVISLSYISVGSYEKAINLITEALRISIIHFGNDHPEQITYLNNLTVCYSNLNENIKAIQFGEQAIGIGRKNPNPNNLDISYALNNLSIAYANQNNYKKSIDLLEESIRINEFYLGSEHPNVASNFNNIATCYSGLGNYFEAIKFHNEALKIRQKSLMPSHPDIALSLENLGVIYSLTGQYPKALNLLDQAIGIRKKNIISVFSTLSDDQKNKYTHRIDNSYDFYDALMYTLDKKKFNDTESSINNFLMYGSIILRSNELTRKIILNSNDSTLVKEFEAFLGLKRQYANAQSLSLDELKENGIDLMAMEDKIEINERSLAQRSQTFQTEQQKLEFNYKTFKSKLNAEEASVMFHSFNYYNGKDWTDSILYTAYIIRKDQEQPEMIYLFEQKALDTLLTAPDTRSMMNNLYQTGDSTLYNLVWKPLEPYLKEVKTAYIVPSGLLHEIAFAALPLANGTTLSDKCQLRQVLSGHDVVFKEDPAVFSNIDTTSIALLGGINYEFMPEENDTVYFSPLSLLPESTDRGTAFGYLPGTESEVSSIEQLLKNEKVNVNLLKGNKATEVEFKSLQGDKAPKVMHIATHGFFAPDPKRDLNKENSMRFMGQENRYTAADNPLYRSGLLLTGGNNSWTKKTTLPADQDGVLTAYEVANMDLSNTQLVVLSACETALGDVKGREGVFGLQRGFRLAGAKYMLMSLWRIPDKETAEYMTKFYTELSKTNNIVTAYQTTQTHMKTTYPNEPQKWAGMVLVE
jgi:tetratricopeptide (TPR) repeat protein